MKLSKRLVKLRNHPQRRSCCKAAIVCSCFPRCATRKSIQTNTEAKSYRKGRTLSAVIGHMSAKPLYIFTVPCAQQRNDAGEFIVEKEEQWKTLGSLRHRHYRNQFKHSQKINIIRKPFDFRGIVDLLVLWFSIPCFRYLEWVFYKTFYSGERFSSSK